MNKLILSLIAVLAFIGLASAQQYAPATVYTQGTNAIAANATITPNAVITATKSDNVALQIFATIYNAQFGGCKMEVKFVPLTLATTNILSALRLQGATGARGRSLNAAANDLNIYSSGMYLRVNKAALKSATIAQNMKDTEVRELTFVNTRAVVSGAKLPPGYVGTAISGSATTYA